MTSPRTPARRVTAAAVVLFLTVAPAAAAEPVSLAGPWRFQLDREDAGVKDGWFGKTLTGTVQLPGALQNQGQGNPVTADTKWTGDVGSDRWKTRPEYAPYRRPGAIKIPWSLQPERHYVGPAWYQRDVEVPADWRGRRVVLTLERPHWTTRAWLDGRELGTGESLSAPHVYDLGTAVTPGRHTLTLRVDNRLFVDVGSWAHSVTDHTQGNWNGVVGEVSLRATHPVWIADVQVYPDVAKRSARLKVTIGNATGRAGRGTLAAGGREIPVAWGEKGAAAELEVKLPDAPLWDEFHPALTKLRVRLTGDRLDEEKVVTFGLRDVGTKGRQLTLNGHPLFLRGTLECCIFPLTGYPPTDVDSWKRIITVCKAHGLNHMRFHSWCPPEAAFAAADELGFYYQVEVAAWCVVGDGKPVDEWLYREAERILHAYGNHPSFLLMPYGNEPSGKNHVAYLTKWVEHWKARDPRRLYTSGSAYPLIPENQYHVTYPPRGPGGWGRDYREQIKTLQAPAVVHEMGQWCVYPNFDEVAKYTGPLKPKNFDIFRDSFTAHGLADRWREFLFASGKLQTLCYKEEVEAALRTPGISGVQLLDLHDFPGQGTALVGVLDPFWDGKGYVTPAEFRRFFGPTVPLVRLPKRTWTADETLTADVEIAHFGPEPLAGAAPDWKLLDASGKPVAAGTLPPRDVPIDQGTPLGSLSVPLSSLPAPAAYRLVVGLKGTPAENDWNVWVYPAAAAAPPAGVLLAKEADDALAAHLAKGGKAVLATARTAPGHPRGSFAPIFWNRYMFATQATQTLGLLCDPKHPALASFPTAVHTDWQWEPIASKSRAVVLDGLPQELKPVVSWIDDWNTNRRLGLVFECRVGRGRLLVCAADLDADPAKRPAARQLRDSLLAYAAGPSFAPTVAVPWDEIAARFSPRVLTLAERLGARVLSADSEDRANGHVAANVLDGNPETFWHTRWQDRTDPMPHEIVIDLGRTVTLTGLVYWPRQDQGNGRIARCAVHVGNDPKAWGPPAAEPKWPDGDDKQTVKFAKPVQGRYVKVVARAEVRGNPFAAIAELDVLTEGP